MKIDKLFYIKIKNFCPLKDAANKNEKISHRLGENT